MNEGQSNTVAVAGAAAVPNDAPEKAVKILLENHRLVLTLIGFLIAGVFAFAGRGANVLDWRYMMAVALLVAAALGVCAAVGVAINQAIFNQYNPHSLWMKVPYAIGLLLLLGGVGFMGWILMTSIRSGSPAPAVSAAVTLDSGTIVIGPDSRMDVQVDYDPQTGKLVRVTATPKRP